MGLALHLLSCRCVCAGDIVIRIYSCWCFFLFVCCFAPFRVRWNSWTYDKRLAWVLRSARRSSFRRITLVLIYSVWRHWSFTLKKLECLRQALLSLNSSAWNNKIGLRHHKSLCWCLLIFFVVVYWIDLWKFIFLLSNLRWFLTFIDRFCGSLYFVGF